MCIIIAKDKNGRLPSIDELTNSFEYNNDGAGFMYVDKGKVIIDKGYMTKDAFIKHFKTLCEKYHDFKDKSLVIHCRIGTSGLNTKSFTHPYPLTNEIKLLKSTLVQTTCGVAHNGIIKGYGNKTEINDTQEFIKKYIYPLWSNWKDFYKNKDIIQGIKTITSSKLAILDNTDTIYYVGDFIEDKGCKFSNTTYKTKRWTYSNNYYNYSKWDAWDDWYDTQYTKQKTIEKEEKKDKDTTKEMHYPKESEMLNLKAGWFIDFYGNGYLEEVKADYYYYDYESLELYKRLGKGVFQLVSINPLIYDENGEEVV